MTSTEPSESTPFTVLMVCTGNICRSPLAEQLLRARLNESGVPAVVHSAGSRALVGHVMTPEAVVVARRHGAGDQGHAARQLNESVVASADLVLTATREHRSAVVALHPRAARYTYTLKQFARLLVPIVESPRAASDGDAQAAVAHDEESRLEQRLRALVVEVAATRGFSPPPEHPEFDDIEDPYRRSADVYNRVGVLVDDAVTSIAVGLASVTGRA